MKVLFLTFLLALLPVLQQQPTVVEREDGDLVVVKFNWNKIRLNGDLIHSALDPGPPMNEPIRIKPPENKNESQEVKNRRDMNERRLEMKNTTDAAKASQQKDADQYLLRLEVKNVGTNVIKSMVWEYQPSAQAAEYELRQYVCSFKAKPNESRKFELVSEYNPVKLIEANVETGKAKGGRVVINRIDYADGTTWKRKGWSVLIPPETLNGLGNGKCLMF
ncbi:MAG TPA: hypothetical protein VL907_09655 [Pyrinomonadaceae bacterium]|nr:hypothetical protein [Pyrinomonadaceae bacterium]